MKKSFSILFAVLFLFAGKTSAQESAPLKLVQTYKLPPDVKGNFDHFAIDLSGNRLFATPEEYKSVLVFDLKSGKLIHKITARGSLPPGFKAPVHHRWGKRRPENRG
jgi:hypothetical protein